MNDPFSWNPPSQQQQHHAFKDLNPLWSPAPAQQPTGTVTRHLSMNQMGTQRPIQQNFYVPPQVNITPPSYQTQTLPHTKSCPAVSKRNVIALFDPFAKPAPVPSSVPSAPVETLASTGNNNQEEESEEEEEESDNETMERLESWNSEQSNETREESIPYQFPKERARVTPRAFRPPDIGSGEGEILARISLRTQVIREWKKTWFVFHEDRCVRLYRHRDDFVHYPLGTMIKKEFPLLQTISCSRIKTKTYTNFGTLFYFTVREQDMHGSRFVVKFGSQNSDTIHSLHRRIETCCRVSREEKPQPTGYVHQIQARRIKRR